MILARHGWNLDSQWPDPISPSSERFPGKALAVLQTPGLRYGVQSDPLQPSLWWTVQAPRHPLLGPATRASPFALLLASGHPASRGTKTTLTVLTLPVVVSILLTVLLGLTAAVDLVRPF